MLKKILMTSILAVCAFAAMNTTFSPRSNQENEENRNFLSCSKKKFKEPKKTEDTLAACSKCKGGCKHRA